MAWWNSIQDNQRKSSPAQNTLLYIIWCKLLQSKTKIRTSKNLICRTKSKPVFNVTEHTRSHFTFLLYLYMFLNLEAVLDISLFILFLCK